MQHARLGGPSWLGGVTNWCSYHSKNASGSVAAACISQDGNRQDVLRYDTPTFGPASISVSTGDNEYWDAMLKLAGSFGDAGYALHIGHIGEYETDVAAVPETTETFTGAAVKEFAADEDIKLSDDLTALNVGAYKNSTLYSGSGDALNPSMTIGSLTDEHRYEVVTPGKAAGKKKNGDTTITSAAVNFGQGTSIAASMGKRDSDDSKHTYMELDHSYGDGSIGVYWRNGETGTGAAKKKGSLWGVGIGHHIGAGATAYAGYRQIKEDGVNDNTGIILAGMRVTFN